MLRKLQEIKKIQKKILNWYSDNQRDLPWRKNRNPYNILISEIMLQQTQVGRVIPKYEMWLKKFTTVESLATAPISEVLEYWSGLGYNRRALNLKKTAEIIATKYQGEFPEDEKLLRDLPGIGEYTARALMCFAFDEQIAVVDTNVRKVIVTQFFHRSEKIEEKEIQAVAEQLLPHGKAYEWNQALMDYSSAVLSKEKITIQKQSKFLGSHRYYRGQILKELIARKKIPVSELGKTIKNDFVSEETDWLKKLIEELKQEGFVTVKENTVQLA